MSGDDKITGDSSLLPGGTIPGTKAPAFTLSWPGSARLPIILAVPHAGRDYPAALVNQMRSAEYSQLRLEDRFVDLLAHQIADQTGASLLVAHAPRAMIDLNRATEDMDWSMVAEGAASGTERLARNSLANRRSRSGLGLVPRRLSGLGEIWRGQMRGAELDARIEQVHAPYHSMLGQKLEELRDQWGAALLIDLHSMPPLKQRHAGERLAEFVIGDRFGSACDPILPARAFRYLSAHDRPAAHNRPYAGGYVLDRHSAPARGIHALQVEICRATYLDSRMAEMSARAGSVAKLLAGLVRDLAIEVAAMGRDSQMPLAAE